MDPPTPIEQPPPAYGEEHRDFDHKISAALQQSLHISQPPQPATDEEGWEEWDEAKFEAARESLLGLGPHHTAEASRCSSEKDQLVPEAVASSAASGSGHIQVRARNQGRRLPASPPANTTKERPSWLAQAQLEALGPAPIHHIPPEEQSPDEQLPPFAAVGPPLDGPPFDEVVRVQPRTVHAAADDSPPQSPLDGVHGSDSPHPPHTPPSAPLPRSYLDEHDSPLLPAQHPIPIGPGAAVSTSPPLLPFDHSIAYAKARTLPVDREGQDTEPHDASAFYNSAVSSFMATPSRSHVPKKSSTTSFTSRDPKPFRTSDPYAPQASDPYTPTLPPGARLPVQVSAYSPYPPQQPSYATQHQPYSPGQQQYAPQHHPYPPQQQPYPLQQQPYPPQQQSYSAQQPYSPQQQPYSPQQQPYPHNYGAPADGRRPSLGFSRP